jgi:hypothetical protein
MVTGTRDRQDSANEEMLAKTIKGSLAPPAQSISRASTPDLLPDNMASRVAIRIDDLQLSDMEDLSFDRMGSRISGGDRAVV